MVSKAGYPRYVREIESRSMIGIHFVHRRLAEIDHKAVQLGGYNRLPPDDQIELRHCLIANAKLVRKLDELKQLAFIAHLADDMDWQQDICSQIDELEVKLL